LKAAIVVLPLLLAAAPAAAANRAAQERAARKACLNGDYAKGVDILSDLFVDTKDPTYIFNQGRCFEQNRRYEDAIGRFDEYLRAAQGDLKAEDKASAEKHRSDCKEKLAEERATSPVQPAPLASPPIAAPPQGPQPSPEPSTSIAVEPAPQTAAPSTGGRGLLTAGIITGVVGVGGVVAGVIFNMKANSTINDMEGSVGAYSSAKDNDQKTYKTLAWVGYGVGAACVATGAVLIGVSIKSGTGSSTNVALVPALGPGHMGAMLTGGF
jgi:tetratricopeptide (TPR) repeat protein